MARPKIELDDADWTQVEKLCGLQCTGDEIASFLDISYDTLARRVKEVYGLSFADYYKKHSAHGTMSLRRKQYEVAMAGNTTMLVWLGKQYLNQKDKPAEEDIESNPTPVSVNIEVKDARKPES